MRWGIKERNGDLCSECTSMQITRSSCIDCQGTLHVLRVEDLWTLRFFLAFRIQTNKTIFDIRKIFVSTKHEAIYIVNMNKYKSKPHKPQFSL